MGWIYFHDTGEFLGDLPARDPAKTEFENDMMQRKAMKNQVEKSHPGTFEDVHNNYDMGE